MKVIIVGGVAGGASCAARLRRLDESAEIVLVERGPYVSYANCGLPYYVGGVIEKEASLLLATPDVFRELFAIDCRTGCEVVGISAKDKTVELKDRATGAVTTESYDKLVLSPGAAPIRPPLPGIDLPGIFPVRTVPDAAAVREWVERSLTELPGLDSYTGCAGPQEAAPRRRRRRRLHRPRDGREPHGARPGRHRRAARRPAHGAGRSRDGALRRAAPGEPRRPHPAGRRRVRASSRRRTGRSRSSPPPASGCRRTSWCSASACARRPSSPRWRAWSSASAAASAWTTRCTPATRTSSPSATRSRSSTT